MSESTYIYLAILIMASVTYLIRLIFPVLLRKPLNSKFLKSFIHYAPFVTLAVLTVPAIFYSSGNLVATAVGFVVSLLTAWFTSNLPVTCIAGCLSVLIVNLL